MIPAGLFSRRTSPPRPVRISALFSTILPRKANLLSERYVYSACLGPPIIPYPESKFSERPCIVPNEVARLNVVFSGSPRRNLFFMASCTENRCAGSPYLSSFGPAYAVLSPLFRHFGSNNCFFFISVQAMIRSFADSFTRILTPIPLSRALPLSLFV